MQVKFIAALQDEDLFVSEFQSSYQGLLSNKALLTRQLSLNSIVCGCISDEIVQHTFIVHKIFVLRSIFGLLEVNLPAFHIYFEVHFV